MLINFCQPVEPVEPGWVELSRLGCLAPGAPGWPAALAAPEPRALGCGASRGGSAAASEIYVAAFVMAKSKQALGVTLSVWACLGLRCRGVRIIRKIMRTKAIYNSWNLFLKKCCHTNVKWIGRGWGLSGFGSGSELISVNAPKNEMPFEMPSCQAKGVAAYLPLQIQLRQHKVSVGSVCCELVSKLAARSCRLIYKTKFDSCAH